jgi:uncharacterized protein
MFKVLARLATAAALFMATPTAAAPALWKVSNGASTIFLFGTMHVLQPGLRWRTPAVDYAYEQSQAVWFETDVTADRAVVRDLVARYGADPARPLLDKLSPQARRDIGPLLAKASLPAARIEHMRPWAAAMALSVAPMVQTQGYRVEAGADAVITRQAQSAAKPVKTFETVEQQIRMFADMPPEVEAQYLEDVIQDHAGRGRDGVSLQRAWMAGDMKKLDKLLIGPMRRDRPGLYEALLHRRNLAWADVLEQRLQSGATEMVNVGALHMAGADGLPALLRQRGYLVARVQ